MAVLSILVGEILELIEFLTFVTIWVGILAMISLIILRKTMKDAYRPIKVCIYENYFSYMLIWHLFIILFY